MTDSDAIHLPFPDDEARTRIGTDLDANLLVEAGAGSGKTTALVGRLVALISRDAAKVDQIAAVTFTRKAAGELRERFQIGLEETLRTEREAAEPDELVIDRLSRALDDIDRAFIGTIHSFCGRLLRERPLDVGLDPGFQELPVEERMGLRRSFWDSYLERLARDSDPILEELSGSGIRPSSLYGLFNHLVENADVEFPAPAVAPPAMSDVGSIRDELEGIVDAGWELMPELVPPKGWDRLQVKIRKLHFEREITGWKESTDLFEAVATLCKPGPKGHAMTLNRWRDKEWAKAFRERVDAFGVGATPAQALVDRWYAHRYALAIRLGRAAVDEFAAHRLRIGKLDFQDLLALAARLLRNNPGVRKQLGDRYRRLLVDEFQDTDPLQAEIMLLLSSDPGDEASDWRTAVPRTGALFVVGDPKQSIYRFRRADIQLYGFVKERFAEFGEVLALSTNFRSRPAIGDVVNDVFDQDDFFPKEATRVQAAFERLDTRPPSEPVPKEGVFVYDLSPERSTKPSAAADDSAKIATWIRDRVDAGEREPQDFLILTWGRGQLASYARALEGHGLPVSVTGAGIGVETELHELQVLLECMIDPTNPVKVVAALVGLFFGLDYEQLTRHRLAGGGFDAMWLGDRGDPEVMQAICRLHGWWRDSVADPADVFVGRLAGELGLLPYAASGDLGTLRAGALLYALDSVRAAALRGDTSLPGALAALGTALELREAEAPLEPGRPDAVRLMNLHQAKGLEGTVVILADPTDRPKRAPDIHLSRSEEGVAEGYLRITEMRAGSRSAQDLARPGGWAGKQAVEEGFEAAEVVRLLYVAVTRAREELVVARWVEGRGSSAWAPLEPWLGENAELLELEPREPDEREPLHYTPEEVRRAVDQAAAALASRATPTFTHATVTSLTKGAASAAIAQVAAERTTVRTSGQASPPREDFRGFSWGNTVHGALAVAVSNQGDDALRSACRNLLVQHQRPLDDHGEPIELRELLDLVRTVQGSKLWSRAQAAGRALTEISFAVPGIDGERDEPAPDPVQARPASTGKRQLDLFGGMVAGPSATPEHADDVSETKDDVSETAEEVLETAAAPDDPSDIEHGAHVMVLEGVIDLAFREKGGWVIADYKTDVGTDPDFANREEAYRRQVDLYADAWTRLTGEKVKERVLFFTAQERVESW